MPDAKPALTDSQATISVRLLGRFGLRLGQVELADRDVGSRKARILVKLLAAEHPAFVSTDRIVEAAWADEPPGRPDEAVATLVSRLRGLLGADVIAGGRGAYALARDGVEVDLDQAARFVTEAEARLAAGEPALAFSAACRAVELLGDGRVLEEEADALWADPARRRASALLRRSRRVAWTAAPPLDERGSALAAAQAAAADDPLDEEAHRAVMRSFWGRGEAGEALATYERLRTCLVDQLGADPGPETERLYLAILRGEADPGETPGFLGAAARRPAADATFVGRDSEVRTLTAAWTDAIAHQPTIVVVVGEAGIGKTRLSEEVAELVLTTGGRVLRVRCHRAERSLFLNPFAELVRGAVSRLSPRSVRQAAAGWEGPLAALVPQVEEVTGAGYYERGAAEVEHRRVFEALTTFFRRLGDEQPTMLVLDDLHNANASTLELLHFLGTRLSGDRLLVLATVRVDEGAEALDQLASVIDRVYLGPLSALAVAELAASLGVGGSAEAVVARTRGHTLFAVEMLRELRAAGGGKGPLPIPESLREVTLARLHRSGPGVDRMLRAASVIGTTFELELLADLLGESVSAVASRAEDALRAGLLLDRGVAYEFANDLIGEILYETTPGPTRKAVHRQLIALLADNPEAMARHAAESGEWGAAFDGWCRAADQATAAFANHDADRLLTEALCAADALGSAETRAHALYRRGVVREALGDYLAAHEDLARALELAVAAGALALEASTLERLGWATYYARGVSRPELLVERAHDYAERAASAPEAAPSAKILLACLRHAGGDVGGAKEAFEDARAGEVDAATTALLEARQSLWCQHMDQPDEARRLADLGADDCRQARLFRPMVSALFSGALACASGGDFVAALVRLERLGECLDEFDDPLYRARQLTTLSWVWRELGDLAQATEAIEAALAVLSRANALVSHPGQHAALGQVECALLRGDGDRARRLLAAMGNTFDLPFGFQWRIELRWHELWSRLETERSEGLLELARHGRSPKYEAVALARLGRGEEAAAIADGVGSDLLLAEVAPRPAARAAVDRMGARLPAELHQLFLTKGRVAIALEDRR